MHGHQLCWQLHLLLVVIRTFQPSSTLPKACLGTLQRNFLFLFFEIKQLNQELTELNIWFSKAAHAT